MQCKFSYVVGKFLRRLLRVVRLAVENVIILDYVLNEYN